MIKIKLTKNNDMRFFLADKESISVKEQWHGFRSQPLKISEENPIYYLNAISLNNCDDKNLDYILNSKSSTSCCVCTFNPVISLNQNEINKIIEDITIKLKENGLSNFAVAFCIGSYDLLILFEYDNDEELGKYVNILRNTLSDKCSVVYPISDVVCENYSCASKNEVDSVVEKFCTVYEKLAKSEHSAHRRLLSAVQEIKRLYDKTVSVMNSVVVQKTLGEFIIAFLNSASALINRMQRGGKEIHDNVNQSLDRYSFTDYIEICIEHFRDTLSPLLNELVHIQPVNFNDYTASLCSIESSVKLLWVYNQLLYEWNDCALNIETSDNVGVNYEKDNGITFAVVSGKADITVNEDPFNYNHEIFRKKISRPIIVKIPESGLYDIEGSLFRLAHEFFHVRGNRKREQRAYHYLNGLYYIFGVYYFDKICYKASRTKARSVFEYDIYNSDFRIFYPKPESFNDFVYDINNLNESIVSNRCKIAYQYYESKKIHNPLKAVQAHIEKSLWNKLRKAKKEIDGFLSNDDNIEKCRRAFANNIKEYLMKKTEDLMRSEHEVSFCRHIEIENFSRDQAIKYCNAILEELLKDEKNNIETNQSSRFVDEVYKEIEELGNKTIICCIRDCANKQAKEFSRKLFTWYDLSLSDAYVKTHLKHIAAECSQNFLKEKDEYKCLIYKTLPGLYKECIADCLALEMMNSGEQKIDFINYLLYFLYEKRGIEDFFKQKYNEDRFFKIIRLCSVKNACGLKFDIDEISKYREQIKTYYINIMYPHLKDNEDIADVERKADKYAVDLLSYIKDDILKVYKDKEEYGYIKHLNEYLVCCINANKKLCAKMYDSIKDLSIGEKSVDAYNYIGFIIQKWSALLERGKI